MKAMIFAAGLGTRLKPLTDTMPKALVPLAGKPLLQWQVEKLRDAGIADIIVNVHHFPDQIIDAVRANNGWGCNITISDERDCLLDTGGGLRKILPSLQGEELCSIERPVDGHRTSRGRLPILACNVDILSNIDLRALIAEYERTGVSQLVVSERPTQRYLLFDEEGLLRGWTNIATGEFKPSSLQGEELCSIERPVDGHRTSRGRLQKLAFSGMQILSPEVLACLEQMPDNKFSLIDFYLQIINHPSSIINLKAFVPKDYRMMDVGKIDQIAEAESFAESLSDKK